MLDPGSSRQNSFLRLILRDLALTDGCLLSPSVTEPWPVKQHGGGVSQPNSWKPLGFKTLHKSAF